MNILVDICLGLFLAWAFKNLRKKTKYERIVSACIFIVTILFVVITQMDVGVLIHLGIVILFFALYMLAMPHVEKPFTMIWNKINKPIEIKEEQLDLEEDFMKTKQGKILTVVCIILVIYMVISAVGIYKLNSKINSVYETVQTMKED